MSTASKDRRKSSIVTLQVPGDKLRDIFGDKEPASSSTPATASATPTATPTASAIKDEASPAPSVSVALPNDNTSESTPNTPGGSLGPDGQHDGTPAPTTMAPPNGTETAASKKKGAKRSAAAADVNGSANGDVVVPKPRSKPGPKKKQKLDDGLLDPGRAATGTHKLGPKASMGAINAGLRALDRSGKPCRRWNKGGFQLKTFTGVLWEIPRWTAPVRSAIEDVSADASTSATATASAEGSNKENADKDDTKEKPTATTNGDTKVNGVLTTAPANTASKDNGMDGDVEMQGVASAQPSPRPSATIAAVPVAVA